MQPFSSIRAKWLNLNKTHPTGMAIVTAAILLLSVGLLADRYVQGKIGPQTLRISSPKGGSYEQVLSEMYKFADANKGQLGFDVSILALPSAGSQDTLNQIGRRSVDLGLVQGNAVGNALSPALFKIYDEIYLFLTPHHVQSTSELVRKLQAQTPMIRVASIGSGSQVHEDIYNFLKFVGYQKHHILHINATYAETKQLLLDREVDLALIVGGYGHNTVKEIVGHSQIQLLDVQPSYLTKIENKPGLARYSLPADTFGDGHPQKSIDTLTTPALLVASDRLQENVLLKLMHFLYNRKADITRILEHVDIQILDTDEYYTHPVADMYASKKSPPNTLQGLTPYIAPALEAAILLLSLISGFTQIVSRRATKNASEEPLSPATN